MIKIDWLDDFEKRFGKYPEVRLLKSTKFHGNIDINFCNGIPQNYNLKLHRKAEETQPLQKEI